MTSVYLAVEKKNANFSWGAMDRANVLQPYSVFIFPSVSADSLMPSVTACSLSGTNGIAGRLYPDLPLRSLSPPSNPLISELTSTHSPASCYDSHFNLVVGKGQRSHRETVPTRDAWLNSCYGLTHTATSCLWCGMRHQPDNPRSVLNRVCG